MLDNGSGTSRTIGAAIGIIMAGRKMNEQAAFEVLVKTSQDSNTKLRLVAEEIVRTGDCTDLPRQARPDGAYMKARPSNTEPLVTNH